MNGIQAINSTNVSSLAFKAKTEDVKDAKNAQDTDLLSKDADTDSFELQHKNGRHELTKEDKQEIIRSARQTAAGWAIFGSFASTLYFGLRSDKTVAEKYNLDVKEDKALIKKIKNQQMLWTLPAAIPGASLVTEIVPWIYCKNMNPSRINVD